MQHSERLTAGDWKSRRRGALRRASAYADAGTARLGGRLAAGPRDAASAAIDNALALGWSYGILRAMSMITVSSTRQQQRRTRGPGGTAI
ncbi:hypothetical protein EKD04_015880 [Chloroflexales bacterium ZM16-3]|nr:hypothetical protein [Chloroflexales bacterium ZM16-3]